MTCSPVCSRVPALLLAVSLAGTVGCWKPPSRMGTLRIVTSTIPAPAVQGWYAELSKPPYPLDASLTVSGSTTALQEVILGNVDVAITSRRISANELLAARSQGRRIEEYLAGFGIYRVLVNPRNTATSLTLEQVGDIFSRNIRSWAEVGGPDLPVTCVYRRTLPGHFDLFFEKEVSLKFGPEWNRPDEGVVVAPDTGGIVAAIQASAGAIGYLLATDSSADLKALAIRSTFSRTSVAPSIEAALSGEYPLLRPLYLYIDAASPRGVGFFRDFALGDRGRKITEAAGFAPVPLHAGQASDVDPASWIPRW